VAVLQVQLLPGQAPLGMAALAGVLDDVYSACGAVAYDEGLQVVRWGPRSFVLVAPIEQGDCWSLPHRLLQLACTCGQQHVRYRHQT